LQLTMMLSGASDPMARIAFIVSNAKWMALMVGVALLLGAVLAQVQDRRQRRAKRASKTGP